MNNVRRLALFIITVFISACASTEKSCLTEACQRVDANSSELKVWWSPALRNGAAAYSTVPVND